MRVIARVELLGDVPLFCIAEDLFDDDWRLSPDHLERLSRILPSQRGAQNVVTIDHDL